MFNLKSMLKNKLLAFIKNNLGQNEQMLPDREAAVVDRTLSMVRNEYTVMPRFGFHQPLDYYLDTPPVKFESPLKIDGVELPVPAPEDRMGYSPEDVDEYLRWGKGDKDLVKAQIDKHLTQTNDLAILDFGCSSGRVLRHFHDEAKTSNWTLSGVDIQAKPIQWMREFMPPEFCVYTGSTMPISPFPDNHFDVIYGFSIFTHIKFHWDMWLLELKRVLKPGGLLIQTIHTENAWRFYYDHRDALWVRNSHSAAMLENREMPHDYFYYGDMSVSQVFWKRDVAKAYWGRYFAVLDVMQPPDERSFQDWMVCRKQEDCPK
jgi:SAM-dependent methyltransferase